MVSVVLQSLVRIIASEGRSLSLFQLRRLVYRDCSWARSRGSKGRKRPRATYNKSRPLNELILLVINIRRVFYPSLGFLRD